MEYREYPPSAALSGLVRCFWTLQSDLQPHAATPEPACPDGSPELIVNLADPFVAIGANGERVTQPLAFLVGQITRPLLVVPTGRVDIVAVRFEAYGATYVHDHLTLLTDRWVALTALPDPALSTLASIVATHPDAPHRIAAIEATLHAIVRARPSPDARVVSAVRALRHTSGVGSLDTLCASLGCSMRSLQRLFAFQVGISPKLLARIFRFQRVFAAWRDDPSSLARVAVECGYADQSHLIRDFRVFAGHTPAAFLATQPAFTQFFLPTNPQRL